MHRQSNQGVELDGEGTEDLCEQEDGRILGNSCYSDRYQQGCWGSGCHDVEQRLDKKGRVYRLLEEIASNLSRTVSVAVPRQSSHAL